MGTGKVLFLFQYGVIATVGYKPRKLPDAFPKVFAISDRVFLKRLAVTKVQAVFAANKTLIGA